ncbi:MAG: hydroxyacid dehydrogenase [Chitinophagales bacterium]|nr:NAD(P)-binding domain-containing protein [Chitinophagales bacterium]MCZ2392835.1 hydroxyacid dehydrogenase [Chitinophagales bacterium]
MAAQVLITAKEVHDIIPSELSAMGYIVHHHPEPSESELLSIIEGYEGLIVTTYTQVSSEIINQAIRLKFIGRVGSGLENIDVDYAESKGIKVLSSPEGNCNAVGEHALGLLLNLMNKISKANHEVQQGIWLREENRGEELDNKTVGIIGLGHTGKAFAKKLRGFDVKVLAYDKYLTHYSNEFVQESSLEEIAEKADVISLHIPFSKENFHFINHQFLSSLKKSPYIIHTCRGEVLDTVSIIEALESQKIKGLGIDVYEDEPWTKGQKVSTDIYKQLLSKENVVATPHIAGWTIESKIKLATVLLAKIKLL